MYIRTKITLIVSFFLLLLILSFMVVSAQVGSNVALSNIVIKDQGNNILSLSPSFSPTSTNTTYTLTVAHDVGSITVTPTVLGSLTVTVNGQTPPAPIILDPGETTTVTVTVSLGITSRTYTINVTRVSLSGLSVTGGSLDPSFVATTLEYGVAVNYDVGNITVTPNVTSSSLSISVEVDGTSRSGIEGSYSISLNLGATTTVTVTVSLGITSRTYTITIARANQPPVARFTANHDSGESPLTVTFDAVSSTDTDGSITSYAWDFGDGVTTSGVSATHTYNTAGTYTVTLTVTDDDRATSTCTEVVTVEEVPWPMSGYNASHSGCSPHVGIGDPWMIPLTFDGYHEIIFGSPLLIGRGGTLFLIAKKESVKQVIAVHADPTNPETCQVLWRFPLLYEHAPCPAIGFDGTVYVYDVEGTLVGLNPDNGTKDWDSGYNGKNSYLYDIQVSNDGRICTSTNERTLVYSPAPEHRLLYHLEQGGYPTFAPNGTLYLAKHSGDKDKIIAVDQNGLVMWEQILTKRYKSACVFLVDQENTLYRWEKQSTKDGSTPYITAIRCDGSIQWERAFPDVFSPLFSEPVLGPDGTLYVMTRAEHEQGEIFLQAINKADGSDRWSRGLTEILDTAGVANTVRVVSGYSSINARGVDSIVDANGVVYIYLLRELNRKEDGELLLIDGNTGDLIQRIVNAGRNYAGERSSRNLAMNSDGTVYLASVDSLMATVPNEPPRIVKLRIRSRDSYHYPLRQKYEVSYSESSDKVSFCFESIIDDPLWGGRDLILTWDFGDGTTESKDISIRTGRFPRRRSEKNLQGYLTYKACHTYDHPGVYSVTATLSVDGHSETFVQDGILACGLRPTLVDITQQEKGPHVLNDGSIYGGTEVELTFRATLPDCLPTLLVGGRNLHFYWNLNAPGFWVNTASYDRYHGGVGGVAPFEDTISITYCFTNPGTYEATLKVWEWDWPIFIEKTVLVNISAPPCHLQIKSGLFF